MKNGPGPLVGRWQSRNQQLELEQVDNSFCFELEISKRMPPEDLHALINALASTPETLTGLVKDLSPVDLRFKNLPDEFSIIESVCHLRDIEIEGYAVRIHRILSEDKPLLPDIDGGQLAVERKYHHQELAPALQAFSSARKKNTQALTGLTSEQLDRVGTLEGVGTITIRRLIAMMNEHDEDHIRELSAILRRVVKR